MKQTSERIISLHKKSFPIINFTEVEEKLMKSKKLKNILVNFLCFEIIRV